MANYTSSWIVDFFHSWPHVTFSFTLLRPKDYTFDSNAYLESLAMVALMSVVWLVLTMAALAIYFCCSKSKGKSESKYSSNGCYCSICVFVVFLMLSLGCIGIAVYGNMQAADGIKSATVAVRTGNSTFHTLTTQVFKLKSTNQEVMDSVNDLKPLMPGIESVLSVYEGFHNIQEALEKPSDLLCSVDDRLGWSVKVLVVTENYRKITTIALLGYQCFLCFLGLLAVCCRSRWMLILMIVLGMIGVTATCFYLGADLMISVAISDYCVDPYVAIYNQTIDKLHMSVEEADYFTRCVDSDAALHADEFESGREVSRKALEFIEWAKENNTTNLKAQEVLYTLKTGVESFSADLDLLESSLRCDSSSASLKQFVDSMCGTTAEGFFTLGAAVFVIILCMSFVICAAARTGRRYGNTKRHLGSMDELDYSDQFLPRSTHYNSGTNGSSHVTRTNNPIFAHTTTSNSNYGVATNTLSFFRPGSDENVSLLDTPPPYSPPRSASTTSH